MINVGREAMLAIGCIQAQSCHTGRCPTGVATQSKWLMRGLDTEVKHARAANYLVALRAELMSLAPSHPGDAAAPAGPGSRLSSTPIPAGSARPGAKRVDGLPPPR